jgi:DNA-binding transcriptional ArsR family regulator
MKSQDILLLLQLSALERQSHALSAFPSQSPDNSRDEIDARGEAFEEDVGSKLSLKLNLELDPYSVRGLSSATGISKSEVSNALGRCYANGLAKPRRGGGGPVVNRRGLEEFLSYGIRFVFPAQTVGLALGIPTGLTAPIFQGILRSGGEHSPVWPDPHGDTLGLAVEPLYKTVTTAIRNDETLYKLLAIVDSLRLGQPRERKLAVAQLHELLNF